MNQFFNTQPTTTLEIFLERVQQDYIDYLKRVVKLKTIFGKTSVSIKDLLDDIPSLMDVDVQRIEGVSHNIFRCYTTRIFLARLFTSSTDDGRNVKHLFAGLPNIINTINEVDLLNKIYELILNKIIVTTPNRIRILQIGLGGKGFPDHTFLVFVNYSGNTIKLTILQSFYYMYTFQGDFGIISIDNHHDFVRMLAIYIYSTYAGVRNSTYITSANNYLQQLTGVTLDNHGIYQMKQLQTATPADYELIAWDTDEKEIKNVYQRQYKNLLKQSSSNVYLDYYVYPKATLTNIALDQQSLVYQYIGLPSSISIEEKNTPYICSQCQLQRGKPYLCLIEGFFSYEQKLLCEICARDSNAQCKLFDYPIFHLTGNL